MPTYIHSDRLDLRLCSTISHIVESEKLINSATKKIIEKLAETINNAKEQYEQLQRTMTSLSNESTGLVGKIAFLPPEQIQEFVTPRLQKISEEKKQILCQLEQLQTEIYKLQSKVITPSQIRESVAPLAKELDKLSPQQQKKVIRILVKRVDLTSDGITFFCCLMMF